MRSTFILTRILALFLSVSLVLPGPAFALREEPPFETGTLTGLEKSLKSVSHPSVNGTGHPEWNRTTGLEEPAESKNLLWQRVHERILSSLQGHPGGRLTLEELARLADVSITTLYHHNYRSLVAAENERRAGLSPPLRQIIVGGRGSRPRRESRFAAGLEEQGISIGGTLRVAEFVQSGLEEVMVVDTEA